MNIPEGLKKNAVICVLKYEHQFLLLKRLKEPNKDMYTPVGGKLDPYESPYQAAIRETREETGIRVNKMKFCGILTETSPVKYNWCSYVYLAEIAYQPAPDCNEGTLEWIAYEDVLSVPTPKVDWYLYESLMKGQHFVYDARYDEKLNLLLLKDELTDQEFYRLDKNA